MSYHTPRGSRVPKGLKAVPNPLFWNALQTSSLAGPYSCRWEQAATMSALYLEGRGTM